MVLICRASQSHLLAIRNDIINGIRPMKTLFKIILATIVSSLVTTGPAAAFGLGGTTRTQGKSMDALFIKEKRRSVAPFAHVMFCTRTPGECAASTGPEMVELTLAKKRELMAVNRRINNQINPSNDSGNDTWALAPRSGDCEDYAITKRHALIQQGWPASALRLAIAHTSWGEGHLVLVVRTSKGDMVLDNLTNAVRNWRKSGLSWHMIQSSANPLIWYRV
ncbi:MAG: putative transglutaminase-like cysteine peptidase protein [Rhizobium sp.]|nr:putative transglutaminase-like cysteine peptidase protein [Rhizobium sp.]